MIYTYSVIIQNQKTMEAFAEYQTLFAEAISSNRIGICRWNESGTTIDTALPELSTLTDDKTEWRAVIVRYIDDNPMAAFESDPRNPYDFLVNRELKDCIAESPIPLVRLTQMLGGVPPLEMKFKPVVIREEFKAPRTVYEPVIDEQREAAHSALCRKYAFNGKLPKSILIISVRNKRDYENLVDGTWTTHKESESSEFWKRNHFPSICRFLVSDFESQGPVQKTADDFSFWYSVMLLSVNEWDSGTIQAYRLYAFRVIMDRLSLENSFQDLADKLRDAKHTIEKSIRKNIEDQICEEEELPSYRLDVPVVLKPRDPDEHRVRCGSFKLLSNGASADLESWSRQKNHAESQLASAVRSADRTLDKTADKMRDSCTFTEDEVSPLNKYQEEDIVRETVDLYRDIVQIQGQLPTEKIAANKELIDSAERVHKYLLGRVMKKPAMIVLLISVLSVLVAAMPAIIKWLSESKGSPVAAASVILGQVAVIVAFCLVTLLVQRAKIRYLVKDYNQCLQRLFNKLVENSGDYSRYMSAIASHSRGCSYLNLSNRKKYRTDTMRYSKYKHIKAINVLLGKLAKWSKAYHLDVDFTSKRTETRVEVDTSVAPADNKVYAFDSGEASEVSINNSGMKMLSPYKFASKVEIIREELYDD